jgi:type 1 fimbria pilin
MKRMLVALGVAAAVLFAVMAGAARADPATHDTFTFSGTVDLPAGTLCDFNYENAFTVTGIVTVAPNGDFTVTMTEYNTHTNLDTGYSLTEVDHVTEVVKAVPGTTYIDAGIFWHLRDASGKIVLVKAGEATFDYATGELISFTPNSSYDQTFAETICPVLGGSPA